MKTVKINELKAHIGEYTNMAGVAQVLNISKRTVQSYCDKDILPHKKIGGIVYILVDDIINLFNNKRK